MRKKTTHTQIHALARSVCFLSAENRSWYSALFVYCMSGKIIFLIHCSYCLQYMHIISDKCSRGRVRVLEDTEQKRKNIHFRCANVNKYVLECICMRYQTVNILNSWHAVWFKRNWLIISRLLVLSNAYGVCVCVCEKAVISDNANEDSYHHLYCILTAPLLADIVCGTLCQICQFEKKNWKTSMVLEKKRTRLR